MRLTSTGLGIGTTTPSVTLELYRDTASASGPAYPTLKLNNNNAAGYSGIYFFQGANYKAGFEIKNDVGSLVLTNVSQIQFPATQVASANANTLDDYEEGTWTPTFGYSSTNPTVSYAAQIGWYIKVGRLVTVYCDVEANSISGGSGAAYIRGLPFTSANLGRNYPVPSFRDCNAVASGGANTALTGFVDNDANYVHLQYAQINGSYGTAGSCTYNGSGRVTLSVAYYAAS
jgi:hypothetical protein